MIAQDQIGIIQAIIDRVRIVRHPSAIGWTGLDQARFFFRQRRSYGTHQALQQRPQRRRQILHHAGGDHPAPLAQQRPQTNKLVLEQRQSLGDFDQQIVDRRLGQLQTGQQSHLFGSNPVRLQVDTGGLLRQPGIGNRRGPIPTQSHRQGPETVVQNDDAGIIRQLVGRQLLQQILVGGVPGLQAIVRSQRQTLQGKFAVRDPH